MKLTETQRDFLTKTLGIKPSSKGLFQRRTTEEKKSDTTTEAFNDYLSREKKVLDAVRELERMPGTQKLVAEFEKEVDAIQKRVKAATKDSADAVFKKAYRDLEAIKTRARAEGESHTKNSDFYTDLDAARRSLDDLKKHPQHAHAKDAIATTEVDLTKAERHAAAGKYKEAKPFVTSAKQKAAAGQKVADDYAQYETERAAAQGLLDALKAHAQHKAIQHEITEIDTDLKKADALAKAVKVKQASEKVAAAKKKCADAKKTADDYAAYATKRAAASVLIHSLRGVGNKGTEDYLNDRDAELAQADAKAAYGMRDFAAANRLADGVTTAMKGTFKAWYVDAPTPKIQALKNQNSPFIADNIKEIESLQAQVAAALNSGEWRKVILSGPRVSELITNAEKLVKRRKDYDAERATTVTAIDGLKSKPSLMGQIAAMNKLVEHADSLADKKAMRFEDGVKELKDIGANCKELLKVAPEAEAYNAERKVADEKMVALSSHSAVANLGEVLPAIQQRLDLAAKLAGDINQAGRLDAGAQDYKAARGVLARVMVDLNNATKLAEQAKGLQDTVSGAGKDPDAIKKAIAKLHKQAETVAKGEHADLAKFELDHIKSSLDEAEAQVKAGHPEIAAVPLKGAADLLATVEAVQVEQSRFVELREGIQKRQKALSKLPVAGKIKKAIDPIQGALLEADEKAGTRSWPEATARIDVALEAAEKAELVARLRQEYDDRASDLTAQLKKADKKGGLSKRERKDIQDGLKAAEAQADAIEFNQAKMSLDTVEAKIEGLTLNKLVHAKPPDPTAIEGSAKKMMSKGGGKVLDDLVKNFPNNVPFSVIQDLAKVRFDGLTLTNTTNSETRSAKKIWEMLAKVPEDVLKNPSLKKITHETPQPPPPGKRPDAGGYYESATDLVVMKGRPGQDFQGFGKNIKDELPDKVDPDCQPVNDSKVDYFDFATLHEVGHSVDDSLQFMPSKEGQEAFGGWKTYGGAVEPIAAAVAKWANFDTTPEQKKYVLDLILGNQADGQPDSPEKRKVDAWHTLATNEAIWWQQANTDKITIEGVVYHEAYKRTWVSYLAGARKQALTGYQFRAPGEWFAELYAAYRIGKLKKSHPARKWLSSLSI
jgi:hypothetical protein